MSFNTTNKATAVSNYQCLSYSLSVHEPAFFSSKTGNSVSELFLHKLWEVGAFTNKVLTTIDGKTLKIGSLGKINQTDGPDVLHATIEYNQLIYHGSVEFHINEDDWFVHKHQTDKKYENVIAHIFLKKGRKRAFSGNNNPLFHVELSENEINAAVIERLISSSKPSIPCGNLAIKATVADWESQLLNAQKVYFAELTSRFKHEKHAFNDDETLNFKKEVCKQIWSQLGVPHNREVMLDLFCSWYEYFNNNELKKWETTIKAGNAKSVRPNQRIDKIIELAVALSKMILALNIDVAKNPSMTCLINTFNEQIRNNSILISKATRDRLNKFVWLPAINTIDTSTDNKDELFTQWAKLSTPISKIERLFFDAIPYFESVLDKKQSTVTAAMVAQRRFFCEPMQCNDCYLFKKHFSS